MNVPPKLPLHRRVVRRCWVLLIALAPRTPWGDQFISWVRFVAYQRRLPRPRRMWFNDVLYRIKTNGEILDPLRVFTSDKEWVKLYVRSTVGEQHNVPTLAVLRSPEACLRHDYPPRCVIKPTHMSGVVLLRRGGEPVDTATIASWFARSVYPGTREANYRPLRPKVIVEPFAFDDDSPSDYKVFCFRGQPRLIQVDRDRHTHHVRDFYDIAWRRQPLALKFPNGAAEVARPAALEKMLELARSLSKPFGDFVRVDFYVADLQVLVGEITHCHGNTEERFEPREAERLASELIFGDDDDLPRRAATTHTA
jgi:hypothetical protein